MQLDSEPNRWTEYMLSLRCSAHLIPLPRLLQLLLWPRGVRIKASLLILRHIAICSTPRILDARSVNRLSVLRVLSRSPNCRSLEATNGKWCLDTDRARGGAEDGGDHCKGCDDIVRFDGV